MSNTLIVCQIWCMNAYRIVKETVAPNHGIERYDDVVKKIRTQEKIFVRKAHNLIKQSAVGGKKQN